MQNIQMVDLQSQYQKIKNEVDESIAAVISSCQFINGAAVKTFASNMEQYLQVNHVIPCGNGTDALQIALMALGLKPGDQVITTPFTFVATAEVIALLHLKPVFVDVEPDTFLMDIEQLKAAINPRTKCIIPVHLFGQVCNMEAIMEIANENGIFVVEDNAQAIGAQCTVNGKQEMAGTIGHIGCTSFFPSKNLGCYGDGGALFTNDEQIAADIRMIANHGSSKRYHHDHVGVNSRLDSVQAAVLNVKLKHLDLYNESRQKAAHFYNSKLKGIPGIETPLEALHSTHVYHQYTIKLEHSRDNVRKHMTDKGIPTGVYYPIPLHLQKAYAQGAYKQGDFPVSEELARKVLSLPMHTEMTKEIQSFIVEELLIAFTSKGMLVE